jgi:tRNA (guanine37-N1)-methyltransferase
LSAQEDWRLHQNIKKTLLFPTWVVPSASCQAILKSPELKPYLGHVENVYPRIRLIRSYNETHQLVLCKPDMPALDQKSLELLRSMDVQLDGPKFALDFDHTQWTVQYILQQILPSDTHPPPAAFEQIGHVAHLNLKLQHVPFAKLIGEVLVDVIPNIETVVNKVGEVSGDFRTYDMDILAGKNDTKVKLLENGVKLQFDLRHVYWCSRLSGEREYMIKNVFKENQVIADPFCGVGAQCLQAAAKLKCRIIANDWNPHAVEACKANVKHNQLHDYFTKISCQDAYDFLTDIGLSEGQPPHHVVMNYPLESPRFLAALRWWPAPSRKTDVVTHVHVYTFAREDEIRSVEEVAVDLVAENLLPVGGAAELATHRRAELDELGCETEARVIRDVAPGKVVVCVSFKATKRLIKHIQGDFL